VVSSSLEWVGRIRRFLVEDLWREDFRGADRVTGALLRGVQLGAMIVRGFVEDKLLLRASALTYMSSLAIIPVLVVVLSIIQWLGLSRDLVILGVNQFLAGSPEAVDRIMTFVEGANVGALGSAGGAVFLVTTILSLRHVEETFNEIWGALQSRSWVRRFANYLAVLVAVPLMVGSLFSLSSDGGLEQLIHEANLDPLVGVARGVVLGVGPAVFLCAALTLTYLMLPNTSVRFGSAALGGVIAAVLFIGAQNLYVTFSVGVARYNTLFGGFAFVPLMLVWIYVSWAVVLLGAEIAYAHQHLARYRRDARDRTMSPAEREAVGLRLALEVARIFDAGQPALTAEELAERLGSSVRVVSDLLVRLEQVGIVSVSGDGAGEIAFQLGRPAEKIEVGAVLGAVRGQRAEHPHALVSDTSVRRTLERVDRLLDDAEAAADAVGRCTLAEVLAEVLADLPPPRA